MSIAIYILGYVLLIGAISMSILAFVDIRLSDMRNVRDRNSAIQHIIEGVLCVVCLLVLFVFRSVGGYGCDVWYSKEKQGYEYDTIRPSDYSATIYHFLGSVEKPKSVEFRTKTYKSDTVEMVINKKYHKKIKLKGFVKSSGITWMYNGRMYLLPGEKVNKNNLNGEVFYINGKSKHINIKKVSTTFSKNGKKAVVEVFDGVNKFKWNAEVKQ